MGEGLMEGAWRASGRGAERMLGGVHGEAFRGMWGPTYGRRRAGPSLAPLRAVWLQGPRSLLSYVGGCCRQVPAVLARMFNFTL